MKKVFCALLTVFLALILCCCENNNIKKEKVKGENLSDGTETYYINEFNDKNEIIKKTRYSSDKKIIEEYEYSYSYDINGRLISVQEDNKINHQICDTFYDKYKRISEKTVYNSKNKIISHIIYLNNGKIKKEYLYNDGKESGYIIYDYYSDYEIKNINQYSSEGKTVKVTTYYKNKQIYQIKDFNKNGLVCKITKYTYKGDKIVKESVYDSEFNLIKTTDYSKNPPVKTEYDIKKAENK